MIYVCDRKKEVVETHQGQVVEFTNDYSAEVTKVEVGSPLPRIMRGLNITEK